MEFTTSAGTLRDALASARHATPSNPAIVAYSGVQISVKSSVLSIIGSDGETIITATVDLESGSDGQVLLRPQPLGNFLATIDADELLTGRLNEGGELEIRAGSSNPYKFRSLTATFPVPAPARTAPKQIDLTRLSQALAAVRSSVSKDIPGVQLVSNDSGLALHSTDTFRLSRALLPEAGFGDFAGVVPLGVLDRVSRSEVNQVSVDGKGRTLRLSGPRLTITARLLSTVFPDVEPVLAVVPPGSVRIPTAPLRRALARLRSVAEESPLRVRLEHDTMVIQVTNDELGSGSEPVKLLSQVTAPFEFLARLTFLSEAIASHAGEEMTLQYSAATDPLFMRSTDPIEVTTIVMPVAG